MTDGQGTRDPIIAAGHVGLRMTRARGPSIYFPAYRDRSIRYREFDFAKRIPWGEFLETYLDRGPAG